MFAADEAVHCVAQGEWIWRSKQSCGVAFAVNTAAAAAVAFIAAVFHAGAAAAFEAAVILGGTHRRHFFWVSEHVGLGGHGQICGAMTFSMDGASAAAVAFVAAVFHAGAAAAFEAAVILGVDLNSSQPSSYGNKRRENGDTSKSHVIESGLHRIRFVASFEYHWRNALRSLARAAVGGIVSSPAIIIIHLSHRVTAPLRPPKQRFR